MMIQDHRIIGTEAHAGCRWLRWLPSVVTGLGKKGNIRVLSCSARIGITVGGAHILWLSLRQSP